MKNKLIKFISLILCLVIGISCISCSEEEDTSFKRDKYEAGTHIFNVEETDEWFVQNGRTDYKMLLSSNATANEVLASQELATFFLEATGIRLNTVNEVEGQDVPDGKYISIGKTNLLKQSEIKLDDEKLSNQGARIVTEDSNIFIFGGKSLEEGGEVYGDIYGVYDFLDLYFGLDFYYYDCYSLDTGITSLKLLNFDVTDIPDVFMRQTPYKGITDNRNNASYRMRFANGKGKSWIVPTYQQPGCQGPTDGIDNSKNLINEYSDGFDIYGRDWLSDTGGQLCFTCHGNQEAYDKMVENVRDKFKDVILAGKTDEFSNTFNITPEDGIALCNCEHCNAAIELHGARSGAIIIFANKVMESLNEWLDTEEGQPYKKNNYRCVIFGYADCAEPPTHYDEETGTYVPNQPDLVCRPDVGAYFCFSSNHSRHEDIYADINDEFRSWWEGWCAISEFQFIWAYTVNYSDYVSYDNSEQPTILDMQYYISTGNVVQYYTECHRDSEELTGFTALKLYLSSKLMWNCTLDTDELIDKYFKGMYGEAADEMRKLYDYSKFVYSSTVYNNNGRKNGSNAFNKTEYMPYNMLKNKIDICDKAIEIARAAYEKSDPEKFEEIRFYIEMEWFSAAYYVETLYGNSMLSRQEHTKLKQRLVEFGNNAGQVLISADKDSGTDYFNSLFS